MVTKSKDGYLTVEQLSELFERVRDNPELYTTERVAAEYKLSVTDAENLLKYFGGFKVVATYDQSQQGLKFHPLHM